MAPLSPKILMRKKQACSPLYMNLRFRIPPRNTPNRHSIHLYPLIWMHCRILYVLQLSSLRNSALYVNIQRVVYKIDRQ